MQSVYMMTLQHILFNHKAKFHGSICMAHIRIGIGIGIGSQGLTKEQVTSFSSLKTSGPHTQNNDRKAS